MWIFLKETCPVSRIEHTVCIVQVVLDIDGQTIEDACWLRKKDDSAHLNVVELDAVLCGVNMVLKWHMKEIVHRNNRLLNILLQPDLRNSC